MIRQNAGDPSRKLLETRSCHFVIFLDESAAIVGFDLEDRDSAHLFQWRRGQRPTFYRIANVGTGYHNRDEVHVNGHFVSADTIAELKTRGQNIRREVCDVLLEGLRAYR